MSDTANPQDDPPKIIDDNDQLPLTKEEKEENRATEDLTKSKDNSKLTMEVKVSSPFNTYFEGTAFSISGENQTGPFDILPHHHNFISLLTACSLVIRTVKGEEQKIDISGGLMHVKADKVIVFLDI
jgi:hypothetical protein